MKTVKVVTPPPNKLDHVLETMEPPFNQLFGNLCDLQITFSFVSVLILFWLVSSFLLITESVPRHSIE